MNTARKDHEAKDGKLGPTLGLWRELCPLTLVWSVLSPLDPALGPLSDLLHGSRSWRPCCTVGSPAKPVSLVHNSSKIQAPLM